MCPLWVHSGTPPQGRLQRLSGGEYQYQRVSQMQREIGYMPVIGSFGYTISRSPAQGKPTGTEQGINAMNRAEEGLQRACIQGDNGDGES